LKAMILAGGMSTRLYPLTKQVPKPLVPIAGEPNSAHVLRYLKSFGIDEVAINVHYLADKIVEAFGDGSKYGVKLHYLHEHELLGSAGAVKQMEAFFDDTFVVVGCDDLTDLRLDSLIEFHKKREAIASIALVPADDVTQYGVVVVDDQGKVLEFQEKPAKGTEKSHLVNTGIYVFEPDIFKRIPAGEFYDFGKQVFPGLQQDGLPFYGLAMNGAYWCDIGTPGEYHRATVDVLSGRVRLIGARAKGIPPDAVLSDDVHIEGDVRLGSKSHLGKRVRIVGPSVIGDGVVVGDDATIERTIVWDGASIGANAHVSDSIIGLNYVIAEGVELQNTVVANEEVASTA
jgi:mannose-1-phosphate guanylyltransferase